MSTKPRILRCARCRGRIPTGRDTCPYCGDFERSGATQPQPPPDPRLATEPCEFPSVERPHPSVRIEEARHRSRIRCRRQPGPVATLLACLTMLGSIIFLADWISESVSPDLRVSLLDRLAALGMVWQVVLPVLAVGWFYVVLTRLLNRAIVEVSGGRLAILYWPLPWFGSRIGCDQVRQVFWTEYPLGPAGGYENGYDVQAELHDGGRIRLVGGLGSADEARHVEGAIERALGVADEPAKSGLSGVHVPLALVFGGLFLVLALFVLSARAATIDALSRERLLIEALRLAVPGALCAGGGLVAQFRSIRYVPRPRRPLSWMVSVALLVAHVTLAGVVTWKAGTGDRGPMM